MAPRTAAAAAAPKLAALLLIVAAAVAAAAATTVAAGKPKVETLLSTGTTNHGQPLAYPRDGAPRITAAIVILEPGEETGRHRHPVPVYGQVLAGEVTIDYGDGSTRTYRAGEAFMEAVDTWHNGRNSGSETLRILAVSIGAEGVPDSEHP